jgi:putative DNA primase/helicase
VTPLARDGRAKAELATPRRTIGRMMHGTVRLERADSALIVAEGIENALSASVVFGLPAWACLSAANLAVFQPSVAQVLIIAADRDATGLSAAQTLARRVSASCCVEIALPPDGASDWNEHLLQR